LEADNLRCLNYCKYNEKVLKNKNTGIK
jgi:hypothetical protein